MIINVNIIVIIIIIIMNMIINVNIIVVSTIIIICHKWSLKEDYYYRGQHMVRWLFFVKSIWSKLWQIAMKLDIQCKCRYSLHSIWLISLSAELCPIGHVTMCVWGGGLGRRAGVCWQGYLITYIDICSYQKLFIIIAIVYCQKNTFIEQMVRKTVFMLALIPLCEITDVH